MFAAVRRVDVERRAEVVAVRRRDCFRIAQPQPALAVERGGDIVGHRVDDVLRVVRLLDDPQRRERQADADRQALERGVLADGVVGGLEAPA